ncbi:thiopurine S-methyltransferase [Arsenicibacter rosenii]|uniref:thiopurine S-methyltransferase n=1 Tax=Arsenicibacter rosenii TaxID=1750698 RepID=A0A1S2VGV6_9BACT|nr:thiopurine S-methyltransferase [Arsenicibacter rosenii]OIN57436.1 thiopurine S-methyltransferase [Arsenicibacter rosenii]
MEAQFWVKSWELEGQYTSFHRRDIHPYLLQHLPPSTLAGKTVLIPLCGKTLDLLYFSQFARKVIGVELVEKAVLQFFQENDIPYQRCGNRFNSGNLTIICGDFFALTAEDTGSLDLVYDRASLVALPRPMRLTYLQKLEELTHPGTTYFLNTLEYAPSMETPPFSIDPTEVSRYFTNYAIRHVESPVLPNHGMVRKYGLSFLIEHGFVMKKLYNLEQQTSNAYSMAASAF